MKPGSRSSVVSLSLALGAMAPCCHIHKAWADAPSSGEAAEKTVPYSVTIQPTKNAEVDAAIQASSQLQTLKTTHAVGPYALAGRIRADYERVDTALQSQGYYAGTVTIRIKVGSQDLDGRDPALPDALEALPKDGKVSITVSATMGPQFHLGRITLTTPLPTAAQPSDAAGKAPPPQGSAAPTTSKAQTADKMGVPETTGGAVAQGEPVELTADELKAFKLKSGQPAVASDVLAAQGNLLTQLQEEGYAVADVSTPLAYLQPHDNTLDVVFRVGKGPKVVIGPVGMDGLQRVHQSFLRRRLTIKEGELYQPSKIEAARQDLASVGVFSSVQVHNAPPIVTLGPGKTLVPGVFQAMPVDFDFKEAKRRTVAVQAGYSTDLGGRAGVTWTHHNLLGNAEQLKLTALLTGLGGSAQQGLGYDVYADFSKPDFLHKNQNLSLRVEAVRQLLYSYHQTAFILRGGIGRRLGKFWYVSGGLMGMQEQIQQFGDTRNYFIVSAPLSATYDSTQLSNPIDPATHGIRASLSASPSVSLENGTSFFTLLSAQVSTYFDLARIGLTKPGKSVIAVRGTVGSVQGASTYQIPPDQRLYAGGPATVRGFRYQGVGPQYGNTKYAIGGTSLDAGTVEFRQRLPMNLGMAAFVDAGQVGTGSRPGQGTLRVGYGAGVRYFTPIGPIRVDVALPMNRPAYGDKWELYIGLGETF
ncbi:BamA/TamA family outer membrane protein [Gluconobacter frateurii]|uniref:autotransporter assembly complex protein TamA n=1 Tax=Gluconobacter frateurii TaxID=38308 RepID=UPI001F051C8A|nr:BamA/TamA family outer membrane protein [Gluconobacter frateurii]UMM07628.1 BamA/TamA family outer membrane protein [Gluconobacter frateurii]